MKIYMYSTENCNNCSAAEKLTNKTDIEFEILKLDEDFTLEELKTKVRNQKNIEISSFPQIFKDDEYIGDFNAYRIFLKEYSNNKVEEKIDLDDLSI